LKGYNVELLRPIIKKVYFTKKAFLERGLPQEGEIVCKVGDTVKPFDILGSTFVSLDKRFYRLNTKEWSIKVADGASLNAGDILASKKNILPFKKEVIRMPFSGSVSILVDKDVGQIDISSFPERYNLISGINAKVNKLIEKTSVLLETEAYVVKTASGVGKEVIGEIKTVGNFDTPLLLSQLSSELTGKIVIGGSFASNEVINKAQALGVSALVVGGISPLTQRMNFTVLLTEGFGRIPISKKVWDYLQTAQLKTAIAVPSRRQLIIPSENGDDNNIGNCEQFVSELRVGGCVQIFVWPNFGFYGEVLETGTSPVKLPSGIEDVLVKVKLETGEIVEVPVSNVGILE